MEFANTFSAEDRGVLRTVEVFNTLVVLLAEIGLDVVVSWEIFCLEALIEVYVGKERILRHYFVKDIEIQGKFVDWVDTFKHLAAQGALDLVVAQEIAEAVGAEGMATPDNNPWDPGAHVILESTEVAVVEAARLVVGTNDGFGVSHISVLWKEL